MRILRKSTIYLLAVSAVVLVQVANAAVFALWWFRDRRVVVERVTGLEGLVCVYTNQLDALVLARLDALDALALSARRNRDTDTAPSAPPPVLIGRGQNKSHLYADYRVTNADGTEYTQRVYTRKPSKPSNP